jgi:hypothetical protein
MTHSSSTIEQRLDLINKKLIFPFMEIEVQASPYNREQHVPSAKLI